MANGISKEKKAELLAAIDKAQSVLDRLSDPADQMNEEERKAAIENAFTVMKEAIASFLEKTERTDILFALNFISAGIPQAAMPSREKIDAFLETLTPSKVKSFLPDHEVTPQEKAALTYTKEERAARRNGTPEEAEAATRARRERARDFLLNLSFSEATTILSGWAGGKRYSTFVPAPAEENENYSTISTTQFYRVTAEIINLADFDEAARQINRKKKKKVAKSGTMGGGAFKALQASERGGGVTFALPAGASMEILEKVAENGQKELDYVIGQIYKKAYDTERGQIKPGVITITDKDLVKYKVCGTDNKAVNRRNFLQLMTLLENCKGAALTVTNGRKKKGEPEQSIERLDVTPLFKRVSTIRGGIYELVPNEEFNWSAALQYYTFLPVSAFTLSRRAYQALSAILQKARLTATDRANPAEMHFPLMELAALLRLPLDATETKKLIKAPIRNIVDEVNEIVPDVSLTLEADEAANKAEYLSGNIKATFSGDLLQSYEKLQEQKKTNFKKQLAKHNRAVNAQKQREANAATKAKAAKK